MNKRERPKERSTPSPGLAGSETESASDGYYLPWECGGSDLPSDAASARGGKSELKHAKIDDSIRVKSESEDSDSSENEPIMPRCCIAAGTGAYSLPRVGSGRERDLTPAVDLRPPNEALYEASRHGQSEGRGSGRDLGKIMRSNVSDKPLRLTGVAIPILPGVRALPKRRPPPSPPPPRSRMPTVRSPRPRERSSSAFQPRLSRTNESRKRKPKGRDEPPRRRARGRRHDSARRQWSPPRRTERPRSKSPTRQRREKNKRRRRGRRRGSRGRDPRPRRPESERQQNVSKSSRGPSVCRLFSQGRCRRERCPYLHPQHALGTPQFYGTRKEK